MTLSAESDAPETEPELPLDASWRAEVARAQEAVMPSGSAVVSAPAPFGRGGLGRHLQEVVGALDRRQEPSVCICETSDGSGSTPRRERLFHGLARALRPAGRVSPAWRMWMASVEFDTYAARQLPAASNLIAFNGTAVAQFRAAGRAGFESLALMSANAHYRHVVRQHARAHRQYPVERPWATQLLKRNLKEYEQADRVYVTSRYVQESFIEEGFREEALSFFPLSPDPRFEPQRAPRASITFDIVYIGGLTVDKGVPLLVDAVRRLPHADMRLKLVGGWGTRGMRRFLERSNAQDPRIKVSPGDPLTHLGSADLCVHPSYTDGFGYAPAEALACGVPVIVSEDTGMKDLIDQDRSGLVLPTGDLEALTGAIDAAYRREILGGLPRRHSP
ncbi:MAG: glycosyltransferase [Solirubrobacterales bacterium]|jgi:glycosyltransferase involved in cell wall biosynthesis|nr:glycosyltransferase [Solirubrobacterales bacterium]